MELLPRKNSRAVLRTCLKCLGIIVIEPPKTNNSIFNFCFISFKSPDYFIILKDHFITVMKFTNWSAEVSKIFGKAQTIINFTMNLHHYF